MPKPKSEKVFTFKQPGYLRKRYIPRYLLLKNLPFYQQGYYPFWFEFSHFLWFRRFGSRENVKTFK